MIEYQINAGYLRHGIDATWNAREIRMEYDEADDPGIEIVEARASAMLLADNLRSITEYATVLDIEKVTRDEG